MLWHERRYYSVDSYLKTAYGGKLYKISLNAGMTCPNRDGTLGSRGCLFCSAGGSGDFASDKHLSVIEQIEQGKSQTSSKLTNISQTEVPARYIAYFQAYTNTYAPPEYLRSIYTDAATHPDIALLSVATRPDCLSDEVLCVLSDIQKIKPVWVELGLQTIHEQTAALIRRGYPLSVFCDAVRRLNALDIPVVVHTILGLPGETTTQMRDTIDYVCRLPIFGLKLQLLHILSGTDLAILYERSPFAIFSEEDYVNLIVQLLEHIPPHITIHRLTGDGPKELLVEPMWSLNKRKVLNDINKRLKEQDTWQGKYAVNVRRVIP